MAKSKHRLAFLFGTLIGAIAGVAAAFRTSELAGRQTRDQVQQSMERVLFKVLDMVPFKNEPSDVVTENLPEAQVETEPAAPVDIVIESRPSESSAYQSP